MNILVMAPMFYSYTDAIVKEISKTNNVIYIKSDIKKNFFQNIVLKLNKNAFNRKFEKYIDKKLLNNYSSEYFDKIIIIYAGEEYWNLNIVNKIKKYYNKAEMIYYAWDSIDNMFNTREYLFAFDRKYTFDLNDSIEYNIKFLPLFYSKQYLKSELKYDCSTVMGYSIDKNNSIKKILNLLENIKNKNIYIYLPKKWRFFYHKLFHRKEFSSYKLDDFKYKPLSSKECDLILAKSKCIIDIPRENQSGLTVRTIDAIYNKKKLVTTNINIKNYNFYCPDNVLIVGYDNYDKTFFERPFNIDFRIGKQYSLSYFCDILLGNRNCKESDYLRQKNERI